MIDNQQYRLDFVKQKLPYLERLNFDNIKDVVQSLKDMDPHGPDVCIEAEGWLPLSYQHQGQDLDGFEAGDRPSSHAQPDDHGL